MATRLNRLGGGPAAPPEGLLAAAAEDEDERDPLPVVLVDAENASGLADLLHQFLRQTLAESPRKVRQARALSGGAVFRSAEDETVAVRITFAGDTIELRDDACPASGAPTVTADFLTMAHLTSGRESPFLLLARGRLRARFGPLQIPFLLRMLRLMRIESAARNAPRRRWALAAAAAAAAAGGIWWYVSRAP